MGESTAGNRRRLAGQPDLTYFVWSRSQAANPHGSRPVERKWSPTETGIDVDACAPRMLFGNRAGWNRLGRCDRQIRKNLRLPTSVVLATILTPEEAPAHDHP